MTTEITTAEIVPAEPRTGIVMPGAVTGDIVAAFHRYQALETALLVADDYQTIQGKRFKKKSAWRKLAVAFNVSVELVSQTVERDEHGKPLRATCIRRASAPNGRVMDGLGVCDHTERKFSHLEHDLLATADTRATNRALADLFGFGEVSAEEVSDDRYGGFSSENERRHRIDRLRARIAKLELTEQVKNLGHHWPWSAETCAILDDFCDTEEWNRPDPAPTDSAEAAPRQSEVEQSPGASGGSSEPPSPARVGDPSAALDALAPPIALDEARALAAKRMKSEEMQDSTPEQRQSIAIVGKELGWNDDQRRAFVWTVTKGRASGASKTNRGDAMRVAHAMRLVAAHSLKVEWYEDHDDPQAAAFDKWVAQVTPANKEGRNWWIARP